MHPLDRWVVLATIITGSNANPARWLTLKYDANGVLVWANSDLSAYAANDLAFGPGNVSYFATGTYSPQDPNPYQMAMAKFDAAGNLAWIKSYSAGDRSFRVAVDSQGAVVATGMDQVGYMDWMTIKTDADSGGDDRGDDNGGDRGDKQGNG